MTVTQKDSVRNGCNINLSEEYFRSLLKQQQQPMLDLKSVNVKKVFSIVVSEVVWKDVTTIRVCFC